MTGKQRRRLNKRNADRKLLRQLLRGEFPQDPCWVPGWVMRRRTDWMFTGETGRIEGIRWIECSAPSVEM